jgi:hypothetical protein
VSRGYVAKHGLPTKAKVSQHSFLQSHFYESNLEIWADWLDLVAKGRVAHYCEDTFVYGIMVKLDLGIGLLGTYTAVEPEAVPRLILASASRCRFTRSRWARDSNHGR